MTQLTLILGNENIKAEEFYALGLDNALRMCQKADYRALFMPEFIDVKIKAPGDSPIWLNWYTTLSTKSTGRWKGRGSAKEIYAHRASYFSNLDNIQRAKAELVAKNLGINPAANLPQEEFDRLKEIVDGKTVFAVEYELIRKWPSGVYGIDKPTEAHMRDFVGKIEGVDMIAINHPQTTPFLGGEERAQQYLARHKEVYGDGIGIRHSDDLFDKPLGRILIFGINFGLFCDTFLGNYGRFIGVPAEGSKTIAAQLLESLAKEL